jgi:hypothetical protein
VLCSRGRAGALQKAGLGGSRQRSGRAEHNDAWPGWFSRGRHGLASWVREGARPPAVVALRAPLLLPWRAPTCLACWQWAAGTHRAVHACGAQATLSSPRLSVSLPSAELAALPAPPCCVIRSRRARHPLDDVKRMRPSPDVPVVDQRPYTARHARHVPARCETAPGPIATAVETHVETSAT